MICDICGKNEATIQFTKVVNNKITKLNLCTKCAEEKGLDIASFIEEEFEKAKELDLTDFLAELSAIPEAVSLKKVLPKKKCQRCGYTYEDFKKNGRLGCAKCYQTFSEELYPLINKIHGSTEHIGKYPQKQMKIKKKKDEISILKKRLAKLVQEERYEEAAIVRDKIKEIEKNEAK